MKIKCDQCNEEYDVQTPDDIYQHYMKTEKDIIPNTKDYCNIKFKIHKKIESLENEARQGMVADYRHGYSDDAELLKSLLEDKE